MKTYENVCCSKQESNESKENRINKHLRCFSISFHFFSHFLTWFSLAASVLIHTHTFSFTTKSHIFSANVLKPHLMHTCHLYANLLFYNVPLLLLFYFFSKLCFRITIVFFDSFDVYNNVLEPSLANVFNEKSVFQKIPPFSFTQFVTCQRSTIFTLIILCTRERIIEIHLNSEYHPFRRNSLSSLSIKRRREIQFG